MLLGRFIFAKTNLYPLSPKGKARKVTASPVDVFVLTFEFFRFNVLLVITPRTLPSLRPNSSSRL